MDGRRDKHISGEGDDSHPFTQAIWHHMGRKRASTIYARRKKSDASIMSSSDNIRRSNLARNAYTKPSAALTILRETVMGPELFDRHLRNIRRGGLVKHPQQRFFRTMEDASAS